MHVLYCGARAPRPLVGSIHPNQVLSFLGVVLRMYALFYFSKMIYSKYCLKRSGRFETVSSRPFIPSQLFAVHP